MTTNKPANIDEYIAGFPDKTQEALRQVRQAIRNAAPEAEETIKYDMPAYTLNGNLVYFAAFKNHIGFYSAPTDDPDFTEALLAYKTGKGSVQFPLSGPMPLELITRMVQHKRDAHLAKPKKKAAK